MFGKNKELGVTNPAGLFFLLLLFFFFALLLGCGKRSHILWVTTQTQLLNPKKKFFEQGSGLSSLGRLMC